MTLRPVLLAAIAASGMGVLGCSSHAQQPTGPVRAKYSFECCKKKDLDRVYHPGDVVRLRWTPRSRSMSASTGPTLDVTLSATLEGGYGTVGVAESSQSGDVRVEARPLEITDRTATPQVSILPIPEDAAPGWYDLSTTTEWGDGGSESGASLIRVAAG
jgi:hypothetical protein